MIQSRTTWLPLACLLALCGCGAQEGGSEVEGPPMELVGVYALDRDAFLEAYVDGTSSAWPDLDPADRERERGRLERAARLGFEALVVSLHLAEDGTFLFSRRMAGLPGVRARGTWRASGDDVRLEVTHEHERALAQPRAVVARVDAGALHLRWDDAEVPAFVLRAAPGT